MVYQLVEELPFQAPFFANDPFTLLLIGIPIGCYYTNNSHRFFVAFQLYNLNGCNLVFKKQIKISNGSDMVFKIQIKKCSKGSVYKFEIVRKLIKMDTKIFGKY
ncbi:hypothetical protein ACTFIR_000590 [Dictyostelium discoideum]